MKNKETDRRLELSGMFLEMGQALIKEGEDKKDYVITQCGTFLLFMAGIVFSEEDVYMFGELCSMFNAKKILESLDHTHNPLFDMLRTKTENESYSDFIKRISKLKGGQSSDQGPTA